MTNDAQATIQRFWEIQDEGDYTALVALFADDAVVVDPVYGTFTGRAEIGEFMAKMNAVMSTRDIAFRAIEIAGDDHTAWAQWEATTPAGTLHGVGIYRVANGQLTYYRDYMNAPEDRATS